MSYLPTIKRHTPLIAGLFVYLCIYVFLMPDFVVTKSDDFGTLDSIVKSIRQGTVVTSDWFEPYYWFYTAICVFAYRITGNFYLSTYGILMLFAVLNFVLIYALFVRYTAPSAAAILTLLITLLPGYLTKSLDLVGVIPTITLALGALLLYQRNKLNIWYFLIAFFAFTNRQNMAILIVLPVYGLARRWLRERTLNRSIIVYTGIYCAALYIFHTMMNETYARRNITDNILANFNISGFIGLVFFGFLFVLSFKLTVEFFIRGTTLGNFRKNLRRPIVPCILTAGLLVYLIFADRFHCNLTGIIQVTSPVYYVGHYRLIFIAIYTLFFFSVWLSDYSVFRADGYNLLLLLFLIMPPIRGKIWHEDYLHIILILSLVTSLSVAKYNRHIFFRPISMLLMTGLLLFNLAFAYIIRIDIDKKELAVISFETLLRADKISVDELSFASFGFIGWKLFDYSVTDTTHPFSHLSQFLHYIKYQKIYVQTHLPWRTAYKTELAQGDEILLQGKYPIGGFLLPYRVVRLHNPVAWTDIRYELDTDALTEKPFALSNEEWKKLLAGDRLLR